MKSEAVAIVESRVVRTVNFLELTSSNRVAESEEVVLNAEANVDDRAVARPRRLLKNAVGDYFTRFCRAREKAVVIAGHDAHADLRRRRFRIGAERVA